jgi:deoxyribodipyrimidine photolyase-related protein
MIAWLVFPHQCFEEWIKVEEGEIWLCEDPLWYAQFSFHKKKLLHQRASMQYLKRKLNEAGRPNRYFEYNTLNEADSYAKAFSTHHIQSIHYLDPADDWLEKKIQQESKGRNVKRFKSPAFMESREDVLDVLKDQKRLQQSDFYRHMRSKHRILLDADGKPLGGKWSHDEHNRKKLPAGYIPPPINLTESLEPELKLAKKWVNQHFPNNPGSTDSFFYPITRKESEDWLQQFLEERFLHFGTYEDALSKRYTVVHHSLLSPLLNLGLLRPAHVVQRIIEFSKEHQVPLNDTEGLIRQIIGWREYVRGVYELRGKKQRSNNFWNFNNPMPKVFYEGTSGLYPVDHVISQMKETAYSHHIERLMVLGNIFLLCEVHPNAVYQWFMEMYMDAHDWVMVPNVYGMSQYASGGDMVTKPYISGSNYLLKMSDYPKGDWCATWDALFWRFIYLHKEVFIQNHRMAMMGRLAEKMAPEVMQKHIERAEAFLEHIY